jgi:hypothetical protein
MSEDTIRPFGFPAVGRKKLTAAFDGGRLTSDGGVMLLAAAERRIGVAATLAPLITDPRDPLRVTHSVEDILRSRMLAIACGYEDADDLDHLRRDPAFKLACGRLPDSGADLCSQPTMSRWENAPTLREVIRMTYAMIDIYCASYAKPPAAVTLDIDDTVDIVHGHQQLALFNAHHDERCFQPIHIYDTATSRPVVVLLRPGKTPSGPEIRNHLRRLVRRIRGHWPTTQLTIRGDGHYGRHEVMTWCEGNSLDYILGLPGNAVLDRLVEGLVVNHKHTERLYRAEGLQVSTKRRRKLPRRDRVAAQVPQRPMQRWSLDFMSDQLADHRRFRILNIVDDHSRLCPGQLVDLSISGARVARYFDVLEGRCGLPKEIVLDNGPEGTSRGAVQLVRAHGCPPAVHRAGQAGAERVRRKL